MKVEITPTANTKGGKTAGTPFTVTLSKGQVYEVQSVTKDGTNNTDPAATSWSTTGALKGDLTGTRVRVVEGCGKVNVFSGARSSLFLRVTAQLFPEETIYTRRLYQRWRWVKIMY